MKKRATVNLARRNSNVFAQFDQKQITELKEAFSFIDQNGDGVVDRDDLREVWTSLGSPLDDAELEEMLKDSPGSLNFTMFLALLGDYLQVYSASVARHHPAGASSSGAPLLLGAFEQFDLKRSGVIGAAELKEILGGMGDRMTEDELEALIQEAPKADSDGLTIDYRELVQQIKCPF